jgi:hypothetical protein
MQNVILKLAFCRRRGRNSHRAGVRLPKAATFARQTSNQTDRRNARIRWFHHEHISQSWTKRGDLGTHIFSDRTINQFQVGFNPIFSFILPYGNATCESAKLGVQGVNLASACDSYPGVPATLNQSTNFCVNRGLTSTTVLISSTRTSH